ncbi:MAG TPA: hypothetical protein DEO86_01635 [Colwellia sp.]|jgi:hypothetical protein|nr:hypothetical protein [Colwellia sp.]|tara:strand:- start:2467 stop:2814 length:348 start_codon:yes stop_codon:yes gene_type:complete
MLDYFALFLVFFVILVLFYGIIVVHDIPYEIAVHRQHPHQDAIHIAGWISLFTLGAIWPFLWIWATLYKPGIGWGMVNHSSDSEIKTSKLELDIIELKKQVEILANNQTKENEGI